MTVGSGDVSSATSLYGLETGRTRSMLAIPSSERWPSRPWPPIAPITVASRPGATRPWGPAPPRGAGGGGGRGGGEPVEHILDLVVGGRAVHDDHELQLVAVAGLDHCSP